MSTLQGKPSFLLRNGNMHGPDEVPSVFPVSGGSRRAFLRASLGVPAAAVLGTLWGQQAPSPSRLLAHQGAISELFITQDGKLLLSGAGPESSMKWDLPAGTHRGMFRNRGVASGKWALLPKTSQVIGIDGYSLDVWNLPEGHYTSIFFTHSKDPRSFTLLAASPAEKTAALSDGTTVYTGSSESRMLPVNFEGVNAKNPITTLILGDLAVIAGLRDGTICVQTAQSRPLMRRFETKNEISSLALTQDQSAVISGHSNGTVSAMSLADGSTTKLTTMNAPIMSLQLTPQGESVVIGSKDGAVKQVSLLTGDVITEGVLKLGTGTTLTVLTLSPTETLLAAGTDHGEILLADWPSLEIRAYLYNRDMNDTSTLGLSYQMINPVTGITLTYTLPCGSPIPAGATCVCNCVPAGSQSGYTRPSTTPSYTPPRISAPTTSPGGTITRPCTPTPVPAGYSCTCNCIPGR